MDIPFGRRPATLLAALSVLCACMSEKASDAGSASIVRIGAPTRSKSMSPNLAVGSDGTVLLSWQELEGETEALKFSRLIDWQWGPARTIARGDNWFVNWADFPSVVPISPDLWAAHWLVSQPAGGYAYDVFVSVSTDAGELWSEAMKPHRDGTETEHGFVTLYPHDNGAGLVWLDGRNTATTEGGDIVNSGMTLRTASLSADLLLSNEDQIDGLICDCCQTDVAITNDGPVAVYRNRTSDEIRDIYVTKHDGNRWLEGRPLGNDNWNIAACPVNGPAIDADGDRVAIAWFTAADEIPRVQIIFSDDAAESFSAPIEVDRQETLGQVGLAALPNGGIAVSWLRRAPGESAELCLRRVSADGEMGPVRVISIDDDVPRFSNPQLIRRGDDLILAWTRRIDDASHIITARVPIHTL
jgi:hypothetical protein